VSDALLWVQANRVEKLTACGILIGEDEALGCIVDLDSDLSDLETSERNGRRDTYACHVAIARCWCGAFGQSLAVWV
jgi:hypothetical protein